MTPTNMRSLRRLSGAALAIALAGMAANGVAQTLRNVEAEQKEADKAAQASQAQINDILDKKQDLAGRYAQVVAETESLNKYIEQLSVQVKSQDEEIAGIEQQLLDIETTNREVQPLMQKMVDTLEQFVALDVPFLLDERTERVSKLKELMARSDIAISEKYRRILEAYQIELEYGRTLDAYEGKVGEKTVEFVRLGRISLMYQTLDEAETGYWDAQKKDWVLDNTYTEAVKEARRVARKDGAPDLLTVPVPAPQEGKS
jgi:chromosome segregation ATPase